MKFSELNKEQKQKLVLVGILLCGGVYTLWQLGVQPILSSRREAEQRIETLQNERRKEQLLLASAKKTATEYRQVRDELQSIIIENLPPRDNAIAWAAEIIGEAASESGIREAVLAIEERGSGQPLVKPAGREAPTPLIEEFRVQVTMKTPYHRLGRFFAALERRIPYGLPAKLTIRGTEGPPATPVEVALVYIFPRLSLEAFPEEAWPDAPKPVAPSTTTGDEKEGG